VINVANELPYIVFPPQSGIESIKYPIVDNPLFPASQYFDSVADRIAANVASNRRTLLYCHHGRSRSVTFILAYLIKHHHLPLPTAFALVKQHRQVALPNVGFWSQLVSYELDQRRRQQYSSTAIQESLTYYSQQMLYKIFGGLENIFEHISVATTVANTMHPVKQRSRIHPYYRTMKRRPSAYPHPHRAQVPPGIYRRRYF
jgi:hypothetical protein